MQRSFFLFLVLQSLLGDLPLLSYDDSTDDTLTPGQMNITETSSGIAEMQKIVISSDEGFVREIQRLVRPYL